jgi:hypothetical protein
MSVKWLNHRESIGECQLCGSEDELRPYGPNGKWVCFDCGMKDEEEARRQFSKVINGADIVVLDVR